LIIPKKFAVAADVPADDGQPMRRGSFIADLREVRNFLLRGIGRG